MLILIATTNDHKFGEIADILIPLLPDSVVLAPLDRESASVIPEETGMTFKDNALLKARYYSKRSGRACISDDSGLCVDALGGAPGIHSSRYAQNDEKRIARLLRELESAGAVLNDERAARFICHAAVAFPDGRVFSAEGVCEGEIAQDTSGVAGFGYDPVFLLGNTKRSFAQLKRIEKNKVSHRGIAMRALAAIMTDEVAAEL